MKRRFGFLGAVFVFALFGLDRDAPGQTGPRTSVPAIESAERHVHAIAGREVVLRIRPKDFSSRLELPGARSTPADPWFPSGAHNLRLDTGERLESAIHFVSGAFPIPSSSDWLPPASSWEAQSLSAMTTQHAADPSGEWLREQYSRGFWVLLMEIPREANGRSIFLDGKQLPIVWISAPPAHTDDARAPRLDVPFDIRRSLGEQLRPYMTDPLARWRIRLLNDRVRGNALWGNNSPPEALGDPALEAFAQQIEDRWRWALASVARADTEIAEAILYTLTAVVLMPDGSLLPAWPADSNAQAQLLESMLDEGIDDTRRASAADAWLQTQPPAVAWVLDESDDAPADVSAATTSEEIARNVTVAIANLRETRTICSAAPPSQAARNATQLDAHQTAVLQTTVRVERGSEIVDVLARAGAWRDRLPVVAGGRAASPPGVIMGPLFAPWTLASWRAGIPVAVSRPNSAAAILQPSLDGTHWQLYIECTTALNGAGVSDASNEFVRVWLGPYGAPRAVLRLEPDGRITDETRGSGARSRALSSNLSDSRWSAIVQIPRTAIEADQTLRIGLERIDASGLRTTWPRPVLPRQDEPGRICIDLTAWNPLATNDR